MGIYTKKGDKGETSLYGGTRVAKDSLRVETYGTVDEANAALGVVYASLQFDELKQIVREMQRNMFTVGAQLASDEEGAAKLQVKIEQRHIKNLESVIDFYTNEYGGFTGFTIPGETPTSALLHVARTVVRRSERMAVSLSKDEFVCPLIIKYLNRMSDTLYTLARVEVYKCFIKKVMEQLNFAVSCETQEQYQVVNVGLYEKMFAAARAESERINVPICFSITDASGYLLYFQRMEECILASISISQNKAYTSAVLQSSTSELASPAGVGGQLFGLNTADPRLIIFGGGLPLIQSGKVVGAVGVSGGSVEEDEQIARKAVEVYEDSLN